MADRPDPAWRRVLFNAAEGRLRAGWRLAALLPSLIVASLVGGLVLGTVLVFAPATGPVGTVAFGLGSLALYGAMAIAVVAMAHWLDRRPWNAWFSGPAWWSELRAGFAIGVGMATAAVATGLASGDYRVVGTLVTRPEAPLLTMPGVPGAVGESHALLVVATILVVHLGVGVSEELLVRGYLLTNLAEGTSGMGRVGPRGAIAFAVFATSVVFGVLHLGNPNAGAISTLNIVLAGLFFAGTYVATGSLAIPIGLHVAWNFALGGVYGLPVSGLNSAGSLVAVEHVGDRAVTGAGFGPEAGLVFYPALAVGVLASVVWIRRTRGTIVVNESIATYTPPEARHGREE